MTISIAKGITAILEILPQSFIYAGTGPINIPAQTGVLFVGVDNTGSSPISTVLPSGVINQIIIIKDIGGNAGTHAINIVGVIDGVSNPSLTSNYMSIGVIFSGGSYWQIF